MEHIAQGNALGTNDKRNNRPERAKAFKINSFALSGRENGRSLDIPRALPWAGGFLPFQGAHRCLGSFFYLRNLKFFNLQSSISKGVERNTLSCIF